MQRPAGQTVAVTWAIVALLATCIVLEVLRGRYAIEDRRQREVLYLPSGTVLQKLALSYDALLADVYWIRAIQHYGGTKRSTEAGKRYDLLYPLLDITTTLDPRFSIAYRFGAIFLAEAYPNGPGRPDLAVALLKKGVRAQPERWQYVQDVGFVYYWWLHDYRAAADWFQKASLVPGSSWWLKTLAATTRAQGGDRGASRLMWREIYETADNDWLRGQAERRLAQLSALDEIDRLRAIIREFTRQRGAPPDSWDRLIRTEYLSASPVDPVGTPYVLDPRTGEVSLSDASRLSPLPSEPPASPPRS